MHFVQNQLFVTAKPVRKLLPDFPHKQAHSGVSINVVCFVRRAR